MRNPLLVNFSVVVQLLVYFCFVNQLGTGGVRLLHFYCYLEVRPLVHAQEYLPKRPAS